MDEINNWDQRLWYTVNINVEIQDCVTSKIELVTFRPSSDIVISRAVMHGDKI